MADRSTKEPQYRNALNVEREIGFQRLGLMTNQVYHDDPKRLAFLLARYKFVAKILSGRANVAEVGCGDAFGTRIVLQEVERVRAFDFDPVFVADANERRIGRWPIEVQVHDILDGPLPEKFDGVFSLDMMEHIAPDKEEGCLANLKASLAENGVLVIGMPSLESQEHASAASKRGHVNCKSGADLKATMERHFDNVFLFSMNDEVVHTGFYQMAHYLLAVCCGKKG